MKTKHRDLYPCKRLDGQTAAGYRETRQLIGKAIATSKDGKLKSALGVTGMLHVLPVLDVGYWKRQPNAEARKSAGSSQGAKRLGAKKKPRGAVYADWMAATASATKA